jgi:hypothetical protein
MGQVALGIRSLLIKAAVFFVLCALLVWTLGGQLFPAPETVDGAAVPFGGGSWFWRLSVGGDEPGALHWTLMEGDAGDKATPFDDKRWLEVAGPVVADGALYYAGLSDQNSAQGWVMHRLVITDDSFETMTWVYPYRLAVEQQLQRVRQGLPLQDVADIAAQRPTVLDPPDGSADVQNIPGGRDDPARGD